MLSSSSEETVTSSDDSLFSLDQEDCIFDRNNEQNDHLDALKDLQIVYNQVESRYLKLVHELEYEFHQQCLFLFDRRSAIVNGDYEPNDKECRLKNDFTDPIANELDENDEKGIPEFWLRTLKQVLFLNMNKKMSMFSFFKSIKVPIIAETIEKWDEPLLRCLKDIELQLQIDPPIGFRLNFHFNQKAKSFFQNETLTKFYEIQIDSDDDYLFYEGAAIIRSAGCQIDWINNQTNVTINSTTGEQQKSFFDFFTTSTYVDDLKIAADFQIGHCIRENLISKAILFYTGEIFDNDYDFSDISEEHSSPILEQPGDGEHL